MKILSQSKVFIVILLTYFAVSITFIIFHYNMYIHDFAQLLD